MRVRESISHLPPKTCLKTYIRVQCEASISRGRARTPLLPRRSRNWAKNSTRLGDGDALEGTAVLRGWGTVTLGNHSVWYLWITRTVPLSFFREKKPFRACLDYCLARVTIDSSRARSVSVSGLLQSPLSRQLIGLTLASYRAQLAV